MHVNALIKDFLLRIRTLFQLAPFLQIAFYISCGFSVSFVCWLFTSVVVVVILGCCKYFIVAVSREHPFPFCIWLAALAQAQERMSFVCVRVSAYVERQI